MITRRRLFKSGLLAFFASLLPGKSKADDSTTVLVDTFDARPDIKCGDRLQVVGIKNFFRRSNCDPFEGIVSDITIRVSLHSRTLMLYELIAVDVFPPKSWAYPGYDNSIGIHFRNGCWTSGQHPISVKKLYN